MRIVLDAAVKPTGTELPVIFHVPKLSKPMMAFESDAADARLIESTFSAPAVVPLESRVVCDCWAVALKTDKKAKTPMVPIRVRAGGDIAYRAACLVRAGPNIARNTLDELAKRAKPVESSSHNAMRRRISSSMPDSFGL